MKFKEAFELAASDAQTLLVTNIINRAITLITAKAIVADRDLIARMVTDFFIKPRILSASFDAEVPEHCLVKAKEMEKMAKSYHEKFSESGNPKDELYSTLVLWFEVACCKCAQDIQDAMTVEKEDHDDWKSGALIDKDEIVTAQWRLPEILTKFRLACYPTVQALVDILPEDHPISARARTTLISARQLLSDYMLEDFEIGWSIKKIEA